MSLAETGVPWELPQVQSVTLSWGRGWSQHGWVNCFCLTGEGSVLVCSGSLVWLHKPWTRLALALLLHSTCCEQKQKQLQAEPSVHRPSLLPGQPAGQKDKSDKVHLTLFPCVTAVEELALGRVPWLSWQHSRSQCRKGWPEWKTGKNQQETLWHSPSQAQGHTCESTLLGKCSLRLFSKLLWGQKDSSIFLWCGKAPPPLPPLLKTTYTDYPVVQTSESNLLLMEAIFWFRLQILIFLLCWYHLHHLLLWALTFHLQILKEPALCRNSEMTLVYWFIQQWTDG